MLKKKLKKKNSVLGFDRLGCFCPWLTKVSAKMPWVPSLMVALDRLSWLVPAHGGAGSRAVAGMVGAVPSFWVAVLFFLSA